MRSTWKLSVSILAAAIAVVAYSDTAFAQDTLPNSWQQADIGDVGLAGSASVDSSGNLHIAGAGSDIWGTADSFHFVYQPIADGAIASVFAPTLENTNEFAKVGLMFRGSLTPGAPEVIVDLKPDNSVEFMVRSGTNGPTMFIAGIGPTDHAWTLHLTRFSGSVTASVCYQSCQTLGTTPFFDGPAFVGAAVTSHDPSMLTHATFPGSSSLSALVVSMPQPWSSQDVGNVGVGGSSIMFQNGTFIVEGAGADIWGTSDAYHFVSAPADRDGEIVAQVISENASNSFAKAGVLMTDNFGATVILDVRPNGVIEFMARPATGSAMVFVAGSAMAFPGWLKVVRQGNQFTGYMSADGNAWQVVGMTTVSMPFDIRVGLAVTSHDTSALNESVFEHVIVASEHYLDLDIGDVGVAGGASEEAGRVTQSGSSGDIWGTDDAFNYYYRQLVGDGGDSAEFIGLGNTDTFAKAGIMIREATDSSSAHVILDVRPNGQIEFMMRPSAVAATTFIAGANATFPVFLALSRSGSTITHDVDRRLDVDDRWQCHRRLHIRRAHWQGCHESSTRCPYVHVVAVGRPRRIEIIRYPSVARESIASSLERLLSRPGDRLSVWKILRRYRGIEPSLASRIVETTCLWPQVKTRPYKRSRHEPMAVMHVPGGSTYDRACADSL
jgi:hypothetical protein